MATKVSEIGVRGNHESPNAGFNAAKLAYKRGGLAGSAAKP